MANEKLAVRILESYKQAVYAKSVDAFAALYAENLDVFDMWGPQWNYDGLSPWRKMAADWFASIGDDRVIVDFDHVQVKQTTSMAFVSTFITYTAINAKNEKLRSLQNRMTCVLEPIGGVWKITHEHTSGPVDHETLKVSLKRP